MKLSIAFFVAALALVAAFGRIDAQSLKMIEPEKDTVVVSGDPADIVYEVTAVLTNVTDRTVNFKVQTEVVKLAMNYKYTICDLNSCYGPFTDGMTTEQLSSLGAGDSTGDWLHLDLYSDGSSEGESIIKVKYFLPDNPDDYVQYVAIFKIGTTGVEESGSETAVSVYPNPAAEIAVARYGRLNSDAKLLVYDAAGNLVFDKRLRRGTRETEIRLDNFSDGLYFYRIIAGKNSTSGSFAVVK